ncbi:MAG: anthranilate phosphoribosyltransferase [bacterium]
MKNVLQKLIAKQNLSFQEAVDAFDLIMDGGATPAQLGAFLTALRLKGETIEELTGACESMRHHAVFVDPRGKPVVDTCGTGGDSLGTFNISTTAAFVVAGAGVPVAKHGNRSISSQCGSADVLAELGVNLEVSPDVMEECIHEVGIGFLFAPKLHPAMKHAMGPRKELGFRTIFNLLGPLANPAGARFQVLGVFAPDLTEMFAEVLKQLGSHRVFVVHGQDGMDEITITGTTRISELRAGSIRTYNFDPLSVIEEYSDLSSLAGGDPKHNAMITRAVLKGEKGPRRDIVCLNAAAGLIAGGKAVDFLEGFRLAEKAIDEGAALRALEGLVIKTQIK